MWIWKETIRTCIKGRVCQCTVRDSKAVAFRYRGADKSFARPTSRCILLDGENISFDASLVIYIYIYI